jgi:hypothetical protein
MDRAFEKRFGTALVALGLGILLFGFAQAYEYTQHPPSGQYTLFKLGGSGGGNSTINGSFNGLPVVILTFLVIEYLVGATILKAGWNVITPKAETIQVRVKPRSLQVEPVGPSVAPTSAPTPSTQPPPVTPEESGGAPPNP